MDVSHFELIWKPQSPATPIGQSGIDKVFQGYFLKITNLEAVQYEYVVEFVVAPGAPAERNLAGNTIVFVDTPGSNNAPGVLNGNAPGTIFTPSSGRIVIPPNGTALIAVLPSAFPVFGNPPIDATPLPTDNFEVRGFVRLRLPAVFRAVQLPNGNFVVRRVSQSANPVRVLVTPQSRATYYGAGGVLSDQTQATLPTASGAALNSIVPDAPFNLNLADFTIDLGLLNTADRLLDISNRGLIMATLLASLDPEKSDLSAMNASLAAAGIGFAIEHRKPKKG